MYDGVSVFLSCKSALSSLIRRRLVAAALFLFTSLFAWTLPLAAQITTASSSALQTKVSSSSYIARRYAKNDLGAESGDRVLHQMKFVLKPSAETDAALKRFLEEQRDSKSPNFHKWLTPDQFAERFGAPASSIDKATEWLKANGMSEIEVSRGHRFITFAGSVANVSTGFKTVIHAYNVDGARHFSNAAEPSIPADISDSVYGVIGLSDINPRPQTVIAKPQFWFANAGYNYMGPDDFATMYDIHTLYTQGINGSGVTIAVPGGALINLSDYQSFRSYFGLPANDYQVIAVPNLQNGLGAPTDPGGLEATLDLQMVGAIARNATILYIQGNSLESDAQYVIDNQLAQIISESYGTCETVDSTGHIYEQQMAQQANAEGITIVAASGDKGPANCDWNPETEATQGFALLMPSSVPEVTAVGGTEIIYTDASGSPYWSTTNNANGGNILSYVPETVWNDTENGDSLNGPFSAGGGGMSAYFPKPGYQAGLGGSGVVNRMVPDVSLNASNAAVPIITYAHGELEGSGGTSASTPLFAGMLGLIENYLLSHGSISKPGLGNVNPSLYNIYQNVPSAFHDITTGDNDVNCVIGTPDCTTGRMGYPATVGYDMATGLGSVDLYVLASNWANYQAASSTTALSVNTTSQTAVQNVTFTTKTTAASGNPQNGVITLTYDNPTNQLYASHHDVNERPGPFPAIGTADSTGAATITTNLLPAGVNTITADFGGSASVNSSVSNAVTVTVAAFPTTITVVPSATTAPVGSTVNLVVTVVGPTGQSPILSSTLPGNTGRVYLFPASGSEYSDALLPMSGMLTIQTPTLLAGANTFAVSFSGTAYAAAVSTATFTIIGNNIAETTTTLVSSSSRVVTGSPVVLTANVTEYGSSAILTGAVTFLSNGISLGSSTLDASGKATLTISTLPVGGNSITASYSGNVVGSTSAPVTVVVTEPPSISTTTTLNVSASQVTAGSAITLSASVAEVGSITVPSGAVKFCDSTAVFCTGIHLLGTTQLTNAGTAALKFFPGVGNHSYRAIYTGTSSVGESSSGTASISVAGVYTTTTAITQSGGVGDYTLTATVEGVGPIPTGTISFLDTSSGNAVLGTAMLSAAGVSFLNSSNPATGDAPQSVAVGDFNGDGIPDLAVVNGVSSTLTIFLGDGKGNFTATTSSTQSFNSPFFITTGDFNRDGNLDLVVLNTFNNTITVLLGDGKGNFTATANSPQVGTSPRYLAVGDFNGDGNLDMAVMDVGGSSGSLTVLLGDGKGNFTAAASSPQTGINALYITVGDFNGDGNLDMVGINTTSDTVTVLLGNGDGTFTTASSLATGLLPASIAVGDFNGDGIPDLAVGNRGSSSVTLLLGNGDGTFRAAASLATGNDPYCLAVGDFNDDGIPDLAVVNDGDETLTVLLGNGNGTFMSAATTPATGGAPLAVAAGDFNGDGLSDLVVVNALSNSITVLLAASQSTATATNISPYGTGIHQVEASYPGDPVHSSSISSTIGLTAVQTVTPTVTVTPAASSITTVQGLSVTVAVSGTPTGTVSLSSGSYNSGAIALSGGSATIVIPSGALAVGSDTLTVSYSGDTNYNANTGSATVTVSLAVPTITFTVANHTYGDAPFTVSSTSNSSGAIVYSVSSGPATITGSTVTLTGAGTVALLATQAAAGSYASGTQPASFTVGKATPTVLVTPSASSITTVQSLSVTVAVSGNPTGTVTLSSGSYTSAATTLVGGSATIVVPAGALAVGSDTLTASYSGDTNYNANTGSATVVVSLPPVPGLTISGTAVTLLPGAATGNASTITVTPTGGFTGAVTLTATISSSPSGAQDLPGLSFGATSPVSITGASAGTATLTITTTAASTGRLKDSAQGEVRWYTAGAALVCLLLSGMSLRRRRAWGWLAMIALTIIFTGGLTACGGGSPSKVSNPGSTAGAYTITVTGTAGAVSATSTIALTVQ